jgi:hypothetical protein
LQAGGILRRHRALQALQAARQEAAGSKNKVSGKKAAPRLDRMGFQVR